MTWVVHLKYLRYDIRRVYTTPTFHQCAQKTPEISTVIPSSMGPLVADIHGSVYLLNRDFEIVKSWIAHTDGRVTHMAERRGILITLGVCVYL